MPNATIATKCAIASGGPAGMMLEYLLARAGVDVAVLEKHADFFRDFRGDTIHPSTLGRKLFERFLHDENKLHALQPGPAGGRKAQRGRHSSAHHNRRLRSRVTRIATFIG